MQDQEQQIKLMAKAFLDYANSIIATVREPFLVLDRELRVVSVNQSFYTAFGVAADNTIGQSLPDLGNRQWDIPQLLVLLRQILPEQTSVRDYEVQHTFEHIGRRTMIVNACQLRVSKKVAAIIVREARDEHDDHAVEGEEELILMAIDDITERRLGAKFREISRVVLQILNEPGDCKNAIQRVLAVLKAQTGFDAVGIRLQEGEDFPYYAQEGFPKDFLLKENTLIERGPDGGVCRNEDGSVRLECTCGMVLGGSTKLAGELCSPGGSFWTNDSFPLLEIPLAKDPRNHPRNECIHHGYASVALVPIKIQQKIVGLIHLNDRRKGCFTLEAVELFEGIGEFIGVALMRKQTEEKERIQMKELKIFYTAAVGREERIIELKHELLALKAELGRA